MFWWSELMRIWSVYPASMFFSSPPSLLFFFICCCWATTRSEHPFSTSKNTCCQIKVTPSRRVLRPRLPAISWHLLSRTSGAPQSHGSPVPEWSRADKPAAALYPGPRAAKDWAAAIVEPCWITRELSEPQTAEEIALWSWKKKYARFQVWWLEKANMQEIFFPLPAPPPGASGWRCEAETQSGLIWHIMFCCKCFSHPSLNITATFTQYVGKDSNQTLRSEVV